MEKFGILSRHIVLCTSSYPVFGIILIQDDMIQDIIVLENNLTPEQAIAKFSQWKILNYSEYYISPGLIDLNSRKEWESYATFTKSALAGGTTFILEEPSFYNNFSDPDDLYCDIGRLHVLNDSNLSETFDNCLAYKAYLFQPAASIQSLTKVKEMVEVCERSKMPFFIDPTLPDPRMLYMASPLRLESTEDHKDKEVLTNKVYAAAFPELQVEEAEDETEESRTVSLLEGEIDIFKSQKVYERAELELPRFSGNNDIVTTEEDEEVKGSKKHNKRKSHTIIDDLNHRIKENQKNIGTLCLAEKNTYQNAGSTNFVKPEETKPAVRKRPAMLSLVSEPKVVLAPDYNFFLASCPESWEMQGLEYILEKISPNTQLHFQNISSAAALNKIRESSKDYKHLTCEIPASHLYFNSSNIGTRDTRLKNSPPIRDASNFNLLWDLLKMRGIPCISSQHAHIEPGHKALSTCSFQHALNGICSSGFSLLAVWSTINIPICTSEQLEHYLVRLSKWLSFHPAKVLGLSKRGSIAKGHYADLVVWSPYCKSVGKAPEEYFDMSPFGGKEFFGKIEKVYLKGKLAYGDGEFHKYGKRVFNKAS